MVDVTSDTSSVEMEPVDGDSKKPVDLNQEHFVKKWNDFIKEIIQTYKKVYDSWATYYGFPDFPEPLMNLMDKLMRIDKVKTLEEFLCVEKDIFTVPLRVCKLKELRMLDNQIKKGQGPVCALARQLFKTNMDIWKKFFIRSACKRLASGEPVDITQEYNEWMKMSDEWYKKLGCYNNEYDDDFTFLGMEWNFEERV